MYFVTCTVFSALIYIVIFFCVATFYLAQKINLLFFLNCGILFKSSLTKGKFVTFLPLWPLSFLKIESLQKEKSGALNQSLNRVIWSQMAPKPCWVCNLLVRLVLSSEFYCKMYSICWTYWPICILTYFIEEKKKKTFLCREISFHAWRHFDAAKNKKNPQILLPLAPKSKCWSTESHLLISIVKTSGLNLSVMWLRGRGALFTHVSPETDHPAVVVVRLWPLTSRPSKWDPPTAFPAHCQTSPIHIPCTYGRHIWNKKRLFFFF